MKKRIVLFVLGLLVTISLLVISIIFIIVPNVALSQMKTALDNNDVVATELLYKKYINSYNVFTSYADSKVYDYMTEWAQPVANKFNYDIQNFETQEEIDNYLMNNYPVLFARPNDEVYIPLAFEEIDKLRNSKIESAEKKEELIEFQVDLYEFKTENEVLLKYVSENGMPDTLDFTILNVENAVLELRISLSSVFDDSNTVENDLTYQKLKPMLERTKKEWEEIKSLFPEEN